MLLLFNNCPISYIEYTYLSVDRVNALGDISIFLSQLRTEFHFASPIPYHVFLSCDIVNYSSLYGAQDCRLGRQIRVKSIMFIAKAANKMSQEIFGGMIIIECSQEHFVYLFY